MTRTEIETELKFSSKPNVPATFSRTPLSTTENAVDPVQALCLFLFTQVDAWRPLEWKAAQWKAASSIHRLMVYNYGSFDSREHREHCRCEAANYLESSEEQCATCSWLLTWNECTTKSPCLNSLGNATIHCFVRAKSITTCSLMCLLAFPVNSK